MTEGNHWFDIPLHLFNKKIAKPVLWLGDDCHYENAKKVFGSDVVRMNTFVHRPYEINEINYDGKLIDFFFSENYSRAKDICLKMMDRLDLYASFGRLDRESYFNKLVIWSLNKIDKSKPDFLVAAEAPHDHAKYVILEICKFCRIPTYKFNNWNLGPILQLENMVTGEIIRPNKSIKTDLDIKLDIKLDKKIIAYVDEINDKKENFEMWYMTKYRKDSQIINPFLKILSKDWKTNYIEIRHNTWMFLKGKYNPINPYRLNFLTRSWIQYFRSKNLLKNYKKNIKLFSYKRNYVYFPLHYEPERTTNPDGGFFHDQFIALCNLRKLVPDDIEILVKEHESQFLFIKGSRGRSPLIYNLINNLKNVKLINASESSLKLINRSLFVATITGTAALESAILGKISITFGSTYYDGCPNIIKWSNKLKFNAINEYNIGNVSSIKTFLLEKKEKYTIIGCQNGSHYRSNISLIDDDFKLCQKKQTIELLKKVIDLKSKKK